MNTYTNTIGERTKMTGSKRRRLITEASNPVGPLIDPAKLRCGMVVWGHWEEDEKWYLGIICETPNHKLYCQYADRQQDFGEGLDRSWKLHHDQTCAIEIFPLEEEESAEEEDGIEEEEESEEDGIEEEEESEEEDGIEEEEEFFKGQAGFRTFIASKFDEHFASELIKALKWSCTKSHVPGIARKLKSAFKSDCLPTICLQIVNKELTAAVVVEKVINGTLVEPQQARERAEALLKHFASRTRHEDDGKYVYYCGALVPKDQLPSRD